MQILLHGGTVAPEYDTTVTHILTECKNPDQLAEKIGLKKITDLPPNVPTMRWAWFLDGVAGAEVPARDFWKYAAFACRMDTVHSSLVHETGRIRSVPKRAFTGDSSVSSSLLQVSIMIIDLAFSRSKMVKNQDAESDEEEVEPVASSSKLTLETLQPQASSVDPLAEFYAKARAQAERHVNDN